MQQVAEELNLPNLDISNKLLSDEDRIIWENMGLTSDIQSMENAAILTKVCTISTDQLVKILIFLIRSCWVSHSMPRRSPC